MHKSRSLLDILRVIVFHEENSYTYVSGASRRTNWHKINVSPLGHAYSATARKYCQKGRSFFPWGELTKRALSLFQPNGPMTIIQSYYDPKLKRMTARIFAA
jgi:hypothetical protein